MKKHWLSLSQLFNTKRKTIHFGLLICVIVLQIMVVIFWAIEKSNETKRSKEYKKIAELHDFSELSNSFLEQLNIHQKPNQAASQNNQNTLIALKDKLTQMHNLYRQFPDLKAPESAVKLNAFIQKIENKKKQPEIKPFDYKEITESIKVDSIITKDKVRKKGLLARLGDALSGKINVQKEQLKIIISYRGQNGIRYGTIKEQMERILNETIKHYDAELKASLATGFTSDSNLKDKVSQKVLTAMSLDFLIDFEKDISRLIDQKNNIIIALDRRNEAVQNYLIISLIVLSILISLILYRYTILAFKYQVRIDAARKQIQENLNFKNKIISLLSHEVRSPLGSIVLYSKSVSRTLDDPEIKETFSSIQYNANSLLVLTNQILNALRNEKEVFALEPVPFLLEHEIVMMCKSLIPLAENKGNTLVADLRIPKNRHVLADQVKMGQLFFNLIGNAIRFTENGTIRVVSSVKEINSHESWLRVFISDNGSGMHKSLLQSLLNAQFYDDHQIKINQLSTGLGIHICREIISKMEGNFLIKSSPEEGTEIYFKIKLQHV
ncbi:sensor histidine kinase [Flavobacterium stagni]|uniref:histidine kinase n=1 Tax=Flavobacterium stagni TaxID=2506421 RepID=A0A4Q1KAU7_9FLAO|nr:HAMP domain-containing sensor histidine kinase [Flavobacterium stagni]RXR23415.1 HAMP domain-containing histidine kinase [Flavobacterium stagni]